MGLDRGCGETGGSFAEVYAEVGEIASIRGDPPSCFSVAGRQVFCGKTGACVPGVEVGVGETTDSTKGVAHD